MPPGVVDFPPVVTEVVYDIYTKDAMDGLLRALTTSSDRTDAPGQKVGLLSQTVGANMQKTVINSTQDLIAATLSRVQQFAIEHSKLMGEILTNDLIEYINTQLSIDDSRPQSSNSLMPFSPKDPMALRPETAQAIKGSEHVSQSPRNSVHVHSDQITAIRRDGNSLFIDDAGNHMLDKIESFLFDIKTVFVQITHFHADHVERLNALLSTLSKRGVDWQLTVQKNPLRDGQTSNVERRLHDGLALWALSHEQSFADAGFKLGAYDASTSTYSVVSTIDKSKKGSILFAESISHDAFAKTLTSTQQAWEEKETPAIDKLQALIKDHVIQLDDSNWLVPTIAHKEARHFIDCATYNYVTHIFSLDNPHDFQLTTVVTDINLQFEAKPESAYAVIAKQLVYQALVSIAQMKNIDDKGIPKFKHFIDGGNFFKDISAFQDENGRLNDKISNAIKDAWDDVNAEPLTAMSALAFLDASEMVFMHFKDEHGCYPALPTEPGSFS